MVTVKINKSIISAIYIEEISDIKFDLSDIFMSMFFTITMTSGTVHVVRVNKNDIKDENIKDEITRMLKESRDPRYDNKCIEHIKTIYSPILKTKRNKLISIVRTIKDPIIL